MINLTVSAQSYLHTIAFSPTPFFAFNSPLYNEWVSMMRSPGFGETEHTPLLF
jgi:hypothetical protein